MTELGKSPGIPDVKSPAFEIALETNDVSSALELRTHHSFQAQFQKQEILHQVFLEISQVPSWGDEKKKRAVIKMTGIDWRKLVNYQTLNFPWEIKGLVIDQFAPVYACHFYNRSLFLLVAP